MATWAQIGKDAPDFAQRVRAVFQVGTNKTLATLRRDGSPRVSGSELEIGDGRVTLGMMPGSVKLADVARDPRVAIHSPTLESPENSLGDGNAKLAGRLVPIAAPMPAPNEDGVAADPAPGAYFELDITEVVLTWVERDQLVVESWHPERGLERTSRK